MTEMRERVRRGAVLLDKYEPGWRDRISPAELDLADCGACVLGQLFGNFGDGLDRLHSALYDNGGDASMRGFLIEPELQTDPNILRFYAELTDEWIGFLKGDWS